MQPELGDTLQERYTLTQKVGCGPTSDTFLALDNTTQEKVILKHLHLKNVPDWKALELFEREQKVLKALQHECIPQLLDDFETSASSYGFVLEYITGLSLKEKIEQGWFPPETEVKKIARQVLNILLYLHDCNPSIVHRDIKPSNLIEKNESIYLIDFGGVQAKFAPSGGSTVMGTTGYMAPEQFSGHASTLSDLYSLGATLVHILSGMFPGNLPQTHLKLDFHSYINVSDELEHWLSKLLEPIPEKRFQSAKEALRQLDFPHLPVIKKAESLQINALKTTQPPVSRIKIQTIQDYIQFSLPRLGILKQELYPTIFLGVWTSIVMGWTIFTINSGFTLYALFSIPFWGIFCWMLWSFVLVYWLDTQVYLTSEHLTFEHRLLGLYKQRVIPLYEIKTLNIEEYKSVSQKPYYALKLYNEHGKSVCFGQNRTQAELEWIQTSMGTVIMHYLPESHSKLKYLKEDSNEN